MKLDSIRNIVTVNWHLKLMSLGLAVFSWFLVMEAGVDEITIKRIPVEVRAPDGVAVWTVSKPYLRVKLTGPAAELRAIRPAGVRARYTVEEGKTPEGLWAIDVDCKERLDFGLAAGVRVAEVIPPKIKIELVRKEKAQVPVEAQFEGSPEAGFEVTNVRITPQSVTVDGPALLFEDLRVVKTSPINREGRSESFTQRIGLVKRHKGHDLEIREKTVEAEVEIAEELDMRVLEGLEIMVMKPSLWKRDVTVSPSMINVTVKGQKQILAVLKPDKVVPFIRIAEVEGGTLKLPVEVSIYLEGVKVVGVLPNVDVTIGK